jgi:hypothetical protein
MLLSALLSLFMVTSCRKDQPFPPHKPPLVIDSCADAFYRYSSPSSWPERDWECDSGCIIGCEFHENARAYNYYMPAFNQSNPYQIVFYRVSNIGSELGTYTFDFCTGRLRAIVTNDAYPMDWGSNNLLIYGKSDGYMYTIKPNGDSIIRRAYTTRSPITPYWSPSDHYVTGGSGSLCTKRDLNGNAIYTFPFPFTYARATWIDDNRVTYVTSSSHGDSIHVVDLASGSQDNICFISNGMGDTTIHPNDTAVVKFCYDANNNSLYWTSNHYIMRVNLITKEKTAFTLRNLISRQR